MAKSTIIKLVQVESPPRQGQPCTPAARFTTCLSLHTPAKETKPSPSPDSTSPPKGPFLVSLFPLLVKKSKDVHSYKIQSIPITEVWARWKVGEVRVLATFLKAKTTESSAAKSALHICWGEKAAHL